MRLCLSVIPLIGLAPNGCIALGAWVYEDPSFSLRAAEIRRDSVDLVFVACNRNDYDLRVDGFRAQVAVAGEVVAVGGREQPILLATRDSNLFRLTLPFSESGFAGNGKRWPYELTTTEVLRTPIGVRNVATQFRGRVTRKAEGLNWSGDPTRCSPGHSSLPGEFDPRPVVAPPPSTPPTAIPPGKEPKP